MWTWLKMLLFGSPEVRKATAVLNSEARALRDAVKNSKKKGAVQTMALQDELDALKASVTNISNAADSAVVLINGFKAALKAAFDAGVAAGATPEQLQGFKDLETKLGEETQSLADAVVANT